MNDNKIFEAFLKEALFTKEILGIGVTQLYKANYAKKGIYYETFVCLSTGIERMEKLCLILDYYINNHGALPSEKYIRNYGHDIPELFVACQKVALQQQIQFHFRDKLDDNIHQAIVNLLGDFAASSGRYSNVNILVRKENESKDCIEEWYHEVDMPLYEKHISVKKKAKIEMQAQAMDALLGEHALISFVSEDNIRLTNVLDASKRTGIWEAVAPYRQLYMLQIIRYMTELLIGLGYKAMTINSEDIPLFSEIFGMFYNPNDYFRSRKTWDNL